MMRKIFAIVTVLASLGTAHAAGLFRAYVASDGNDSNPCTLAAPCRLLPAALAAATDGGEVWMLDSANYNTGPVNITQSVTILAIPGAVGSVVALGGNAFVIATAGVKVTLRNLVIVPFTGTLARGISMTAGSALTLENCVVANLATGIFVDAEAKVRVLESSIRGNDNGIEVRGGAKLTVARSFVGQSAFNGILAGGTTSSTVLVHVTDSTLYDNGSNGLLVVGSVATAVMRASIVNSSVVRNGADGIKAEAFVPGGTVTLAATNNLVTDNTSGITAASSGAQVYASGNTISGNAIGLTNFSAILESYGNNALRGNSGATSGAITGVSLQ